MEYSKEDLMEAKKQRVGHLGIVVFEQNRSAVFQTFGEVVLGCNRR